MTSYSDISYDEDGNFKMFFSMGGKCITNSLGQLNSCSGFAITYPSGKGEFHIDGIEYPPYEFFTKLKYSEESLIPFLFDNNIEVREGAEHRLKEIESQSSI